MMPEKELSSIIFLAACNLFVLLLFCGSVGWIIYLLVRKKNTHRTATIAALAVTLLFFNRTLHQAIFEPLRTLVTNIQKLFFIFYQPDVKDSGRYDLNEFSVSVVQLFDFFPLSKLLFAIAFWILIYYLIKALIRNGAFDDANAATATGGGAILYNTLVLGTLLFSFFLVISVCITIPFFNKFSQPTTFTKDRLSSFLDSTSTQTFSLNIAEGTLFDKERLKDAVLSDDMTKQKWESLPKSIQDQLNQAMDHFDHYYQLGKKDREKVIQLLVTSVKTYHEREKKYKEELLINFERGSQSIVVDKADLFQLSVKYFYDFVNWERKLYGYKVQYIDDIDNQNRSALKNAVDEVKTSINKFTDSVDQDTTGNRFVYIDYLKPRFNGYYNYDVFELGDRNSFSFLPFYQKDGSEWGIFGMLANYLIQTQSSDLVLLMGMFGFGLLGASLLSFQQPAEGTELLRAFKTTQLIPNFLNVLVRGLGAALVIYLATKGGLAIFSAGQSTDTNGYILLLACFVGAVYSEKVWDKIYASFYGDGAIGKTTTANQRAAPGKPVNHTDDKGEDKKDDPSKGGEG